MDLAVAYAFLQLGYSDEALQKAKNYIRSGMVHLLYISRNSESLHFFHFYLFLSLFRMNLPCWMDGRQSSWNSVRPLLDRAKQFGYRRYRRSCRFISKMSLCRSWLSTCELWHLSSVVRSRIVFRSDAFLEVGFFSTDKLSHHLITLDSDFLLPTPSE